MKKKNRVLFPVVSSVIFLICVMIDQISKFLAKKYLQGTSGIEIIKNVFSLDYLEGGNKGAAWGIFSGKISFLLILNFLILFFLILLFLYLERRKSDLQNSLQIIKKVKVAQLFIIIMCAGAVGNIIDRIRLGYVIDFLAFRFIQFPIFNIADCFVVVSAVMLLIIFAFWLKEEELNIILQHPQQ